MGNVTIKNTDTKTTLYDRLGGIYGITAVIDKFSDRILANKDVGYNSKNLFLREWSRSFSKDRLPGLKFLRSLWVADITGSKYKFEYSSPDIKGRCPFSLEKVHQRLQISDAEFDIVAGILKKTMQEFPIAEADQDAVLDAFSKHKTDIVDHKCL